jgi:hypothetical protein
MSTSLSLKPTEVSIKVVAFVLTLSVKFPAASEEVPIFEPLTVTETPPKGLPLSSTIFPVIVLVWEKTDCVKSTQMSVRHASLASSR